jgi:hypothetical protein
VKPAKNLPTYALFLALAAVPAFAMACGNDKPPMTPDSTGDDGGALPSTDGVPTSMPSVPSPSLPGASGFNPSK